MPARAYASAALTFTARAQRAVDAACPRFGLPTLLLMENAGSALAQEGARILRRTPAAHAGILLLIGPGNNGADALVAARHLHAHGHPLALLCARPLRAMTGDGAVHARITARLRLPTFTLAQRTPPEQALRAACAALPGRHPALIIDALLGTGLSRPVTGALASLIHHVNALARARPAPVLACDLPSGLHADTGACLVEPPAPGQPATCLRATHTLSLMGLKPAMHLARARRLCGRIRVAPIGVPAPLLTRWATPPSIG
jgi:hydroxyethylthiazole kinase-like uncharacterized protein yjeF